MKVMWPRKRRRTYNRSEGSGFFKQPASGFKKKRKIFNLKTILNWLAIVVIAGTLAATIGIFLLIAYLGRQLPDPNRLRDRNIPQTTKIYDRTGETILYEIHGDQKRTLVELDDISKNAIDASLSAEDRHFYEHGGFQITGILRSVYINFKRLVTPGSSGKLVSGSTITQQLVKLSILNSEQKISRKIKEIFLSIELERRYSKDEILKMYLNEIPYGSLSFGIESASQTFFGKSAKDLTIDEAALLSILPRATTYFSPYGAHRDELLKRQKIVIDIMAEDGRITPEQAKEAKQVDVLNKIIERQSNILAPHFVFYVREILAAEYGEQTVEEGGLKVITTLDIDKQQLAEKAVQENYKRVVDGGGNSAALLALDPKTGEVLAMIGSADYFNDKINGKYNALTGRLQPGSSIKPLVYAAGLEKGFTPNTVFYDVSTNFAASGREYRPSNHDGKENGPLTMREALASSINIPAIKMLYLVGIDNFLNFLEDTMGYEIPPRNQLGLSVAIGGMTINPIEHIAAYMAFADDGKKPDLRAVLKVEDSNGNTIFEDKQTEPKRVLDEQVARQINSILSDDEARHLTFGPGGVLTIPGRTVAAKTGTTNNYKDAWTIGYTPTLVTGVWVGDQVEGQAMNYLGGSRLAGPIWKQFMREALAGTPDVPFTAPEEVETGKAVLDGDKSAQTLIKIDKVTGKLATEYTPEDMIEEKPFGSLHSILYFVNPEDPQGEPPEHPEDDPQFENWENAILDWAERNDIKPETELPPTEYDDIHTLENQPSISFNWPGEGVTLSSRNPTVTVTTSAPRGVAKVEYYMDDILVGRSKMSPFITTLSIPNRVLKGFHSLQAIAFDDVGNRKATSVNINLTAPAGELGLLWKNVYDNSHVNKSQFPFGIKMSITDHESVDKMTISVIDSYGNKQKIGSVDHPPLPNMSFEWTSAASGYYSILVEATLVTGDERNSVIHITVE